MGVRESNPGAGGFCCGAVIALRVSAPALLVDSNGRNHESYVLCSVRRSALCYQIRIKIDNFDNRVKWDSVVRPYTIHWGGKTERATSDSLSAYVGYTDYEH